MLLLVRTVRREGNFNAGRDKRTTLAETDAGVGDPIATSQDLVRLLAGQRAVFSEFRQPTDRLW